MAEDNTTNERKNSFENTVFMGKPVVFEEAMACLIPVPYSSTPYTEGTKDAPNEILLNWNLEDYDLDLGYSPCTMGIYPLPEHEYNGKEGLAQISSIAKEMFNLDKFPVFLGGDQTITIATSKAALETFGDVTVIFFDAHSDLKGSSDESELSNMSSVGHLNEANTIQIGVRSIGSEELDSIEERDAFNKISSRELTQVLRSINKNVYLSIDVDVFDPSIMPATPMPEPDGMKWDEVVDIIHRIAAKKNIVGCDITEHAPIEGMAAPSIMCAQLAYKIIGIKFEKEEKARSTR